MNSLFSIIRTTFRLLVAIPLLLLWWPFIFLLWVQSKFTDRLSFESFFTLFKTRYVVRLQRAREKAFSDTLTLKSLSSEEIEFRLAVIDYMYYFLSVETLSQKYKKQYYRSHLHPFAEGLSKTSYCGIPFSNRQAFIFLKSLTKDCRFAYLSLMGLDSNHLSNANEALRCGSFRKFNSTIHDKDMTDSFIILRRISNDCNSKTKHLLFVPVIRFVYHEYCDSCRDTTSGYHKMVKNFYKSKLAKIIDNDIEEQFVLIKSALEHMDSQSSILKDLFLGKERVLRIDYDNQSYRKHVDRNLVRKTIEWGIISTLDTSVGHPLSPLMIETYKKILSVAGYDNYLEVCERFIKIDREKVNPSRVIVQKVSVNHKKMPFESCMVMENGIPKVRLPKEYFCDDRFHGSGFSNNEYVADFSDEFKAKGQETLELVLNELILERTGKNNEKYHYLRAEEIDTFLYRLSGRNRPDEFKPIDINDRNFRVIAWFLRYSHVKKDSAFKKFESIKGFETTTGKSVVLKAKIQSVAAERLNSIVQDENKETEKSLLDVAAANILFEHYHSIVDKTI